MERNPFQRVTRWFQQTRSTSSEIVSQPSLEELARQEEEKRRRKNEEFRQWILLGISLVTLFILLLEKLPNIQQLLFPPPESFSCEEVSFKIPKNWKAQGCYSVAHQPDAQIVLKSSQDDQKNLPKILLIVEDVRDLDFDLKDFYEQKKEENQLIIEGKVYPDFKFQGHNAFQLVYQNDKVKRLDIGFLYGTKAYIIGYEATVKDFDRYEKEAKKIINSLKLNQEKLLKMRG